ncbi:MAG: PD40 domain-containing protein [Chloroflexi bacterium]|nr:PD40 domain-containing protein [Chloroflexota bacterium]
MMTFPFKKTLIATTLLASVTLGAWQSSARAQDPAPDSWIVYEADVADFTGHNPDIYLLNVTSGEIEKLTENLVNRQFLRNTDPVFSPDGSKIAFVSDRDDAASTAPLTEIYVMERDGSNQTRVTFNDVYDFSPTWLDDEHLVYTSGFKPGKLTILNLTDGTETSLGIEGYSPAPNADGTEIAYVFNGGLYVVQADGSDPRQVIAGIAGIAGPSWSPDGSQFLFTSLDETARGIYVVDADGQNLQQLSDEAVLSTAWSPDGLTIAYVLIGGIPQDGMHPDINLYAMQADGSDPHLLAALAGWNANLDWQ